MPQRDWFTHYARYFPTVEVNYTFYRLPQEQTFWRWQEQSPPGFVYALKAPRVITHLRKLSQVEEPVNRFLERARGLATRVGPILYQLPPNWHCDVQRLADFLALLPGDLRHVVEFRDKSWHNDEVVQLLKERNVGFCHVDGPEFDCPFLVTGTVAHQHLAAVINRFPAFILHAELIVAIDPAFQELPTAPAPGLKWVVAFEWGWW